MMAARGPLLRCGVTSMSVGLVRRVERAAAVVWLAVAAYAFSDAGVSYRLWMALFLWMLALAGWWLLRSAAALFSGFRGTESWRSRLFVPAILATGILIAMTPVLLIVRVRASERALLSSAPALSQVPAVTLFERGQRVGLFRVRQFEQIGTEMRFLTGECGLIDQCGVVYSPSGRPPNRGEDAFRHLYGPWWHWYQSF